MPVELGIDPTVIANQVGGMLSQSHTLFLFSIIRSAHAMKETDAAFQECLSGMCACSSLNPNQQGLSAR